MTLALTRGTGLLVGAMVVLFVLAQATGSSWLMLGAAAAAAVLVASVAIRPRLSDLDVKVAGPTRVVAGRPLVRTLTITNRGSQPLPCCAWQERSVALGGFCLDVPPLGPGEVYTTQLVTPSPQRGVHRDVCVISSTAPFGLLRFEQRLAGAVERLVHPPTSRVLLPGSTGRARIGGSSRVAGDGLEVLGLRPWRPGDHARWVSARASARRGQAVVIEREREVPRLRPLVVLASGGPRLGWDEDVAQAASMAVQALVEGRQVLLVSGVGPHRSVRTREQVLDFFARVDDGRSVTRELIAEAVRLVHPGGIVVHLAGAGSEFLVTETSSDSSCCVTVCLHG